MKGLKFNSQICTTRGQSERLLALGLKPETADMRYDCIGRMSDTEMTYREKPIIGPVISYYDIPAWSLHRLLMMIDSDVQTDGRYISLPNYGFVKKDNIYDNLCDCIEWLIKEGYFNKEYLV